MFKPVRKNTERQSLGLRDRFVGRLTVGERTRKFKHLCEPAAVILLFVLNCESHGHSSRACYHESEPEGSTKTSWCWVSLKKWHGRPAREITRKMRVPPQTDPLPTSYSLARLSITNSASSRSGTSASG